MPILDEKWAEIEEHLKGFFARCEFRLGDTTITVSRRPYSEGQMWLAVYIDGSFNIGWGWPDSEMFRPIVKQLWRRRTMAYYGPAEKKKTIKAFGARRARKIFPNLDEVREWWEPVFPKAAPLVRQLRKIEGLEYVREDHSAESLDVD